MFDIQSIASWVQDTEDSEVESFPYENTTPLPVLYATPPLSRSSSQVDPKGTAPAPVHGIKRTWQKTQRLEMQQQQQHGYWDNEETSRKNKRPRRAGPKSQQSISTDSINSLLGDTVILSQSTHSEETGNTPSRCSSPKRDLINALRCATPNIDCKALKHVHLPEKVMVLLQAVTTGFDSGFIPIGLKDRLRTVDPYNASCIPAHAYDHTPRATKELDTLWKLVDAVSTNAESCHEYCRDENAWCEKVVLPLMQAAVEGKEHNAIFEVDNIQSQAIESTLLPSVLSVSVKKKADYAGTYSRRIPEVKAVYDTISFAGKGLSLSQMSDTYQKRVALFCGAEVKRSGGDEIESLAQLAIWMSAGLRRLQTLRLRRVTPAEQTSTTDTPSAESQQSHDRGSEANEDTNHSPVQSGQEDSQTVHKSLPLLGWTICGHTWSLYLAWIIDDGSPQTQIAGPIPSLMINTSDYYGIFKLLSLLQRTEKYGRTVHWPWLKKEVLEPLLEK